MILLTKLKIWNKWKKGNKTCRNITKTNLKKFKDKWNSFKTLKNKKKTISKNNKAIIDSIFSIKEKYK